MEPKRSRFTNAPEFKWHWMMWWCRDNGLHPGDHWDRAEEAYIEKLKQKEY